MNNSNQTATPESVWAILQETSLQIKDLKESQIETDRLMKESIKDLKATQAETSLQIKDLKETQAETSLQIKDLKESQIETDRLMKESIKDLKETQAETSLQIKESERMLTKRHAESERILTEKQVETDRLIKEIGEQLKVSSADFDRRMNQNIKWLKKTVGHWDNNHGSFAEQYFHSSFKKGEKGFFGEQFDDIENNIKGPVTGFKDEYDILLINCKAVCIIEVKFTANEEHIAKVLKKAITFRVNFPYYANHKIYLGFATLAFPLVPKDLEQKFLDEGIAVIKQVGDTVVISDQNLKTF
jgi:hypothetical protein